MLCKVENCIRSTFVLGLCTAHYRRFKRHGDPLGGGTSRGLPAEFLESARRYDSDECLIWPFHRNDSGYPYITDGTKKKRVTRVLCEEANGATPSPQHEAAHSCGNGHLGCVNRHHLRWATHIENEKDKITHGTRLGKRTPRTDFGRTPPLKGLVLLGQPIASHQDK